MNVLLEALEGVGDLIAPVPIIIEKEEQILTNGFPVTTSTTYDTYAHIQPLTPFEITKLTDSSLDSRSFFRFWILGDLIKVLNMLNQTMCSITFENRKFTIFSKDDWVGNGWIEVVGTEVKNV